jgi:hypothetical protein
MCDCHSYNGDFGATPEEILPRPDWMPDGQRVNGVPVDYCIAPVIKHLWANGVVTLSSCCGHNGRFGFPSIVLGESESNVSRIRQLIADKDSRTFEITQWKRVIL